MRKKFSQWEVCRTNPPMKPGFGVYCKEQPSNKIWIEEDGIATEAEASNKALMLNLRQIKPTCFEKKREEAKELARKKVQRK